MKMLRFGNKACLMAPGFPVIMLVDAKSDKRKNAKGIWLSGIEGGVDSEIRLPPSITFDQAIEMVEESAQANLDQALTLLARKLKGPWQAKK